MKFSIVTISYNQADFLKYAIPSVLNQDYHEIEYIVVDPGSTDGSREIIEKYSDKIDKIILEPDSGPADGLNKGFKYATGDVFGFLNADDFILPGAITKVANLFKERYQVDVIVGHGIVVDQQGTEVRKVYSDKFSLLWSAYGASVIIQPSTYFRKSVFNLAGGFNPANRSNWDNELFIDMKMKGANFLLFDAFLSAYRLHSLSITGSKKLDARIRLYNKARFQKIMGRSMNKQDQYLSVFFKILKHLINYRDTYERIRNGPIYGRYKNNN